MSGGLTPAGEGDARARVAGAMGLSQRLIDALRFVVRPTFAPAPMAWGRTAALALLVVFVLDLGLGLLIDGALAAGDSASGFLPETLDRPQTLAEDLFTALLVAPLLEELLFRGWLRGQAAGLRFAAVGFSALALLAASRVVPATFAMPVALAGAALVFAGLIRWGRAHPYDAAVPAWFVRHFHWLVWGSSLLFGLIHLGNYAPLTHPLGLLVVLPQTVGGLLLAYTRTRLGLRAAIAHHAAYNAVLTALEYAGWVSG